MSSKGREKQICKSERMEHRHKKRKHSDCSDRKTGSERQMKYSRHRRKDDSSSSSDSSGCSESDQSSSEFETKKRDKKKRKEKKSKSKSLKKAKKHKKFKKKKKQKSRELEGHEDSKLSRKKDFKVKNSPLQVTTSVQPGSVQRSVVSETSEPVPKKRSMVPMTKEQYEKQQSVVRRVYDPESGRHRLVKGDGEIIEEIVSQQRHREINKTATKGDGAFFQAVLGFSDK